MLNACNNYDNKLRNIYGRELLYKLLQIKTSNSVFNYNNNISSTKEPKKTKLTFNNKARKNKSIFYSILHQLLVLVL